MFLNRLSVRRRGNMKCVSWGDKDWAENGGVVACSVRNWPVVADDAALEVGRARREGVGRGREVRDE